jgi:uncharacterized membrane protein
MFSYEKNKWRMWEIDFLRGIAIVLMIDFHYAWFLNYFGFVSVDLNNLFWGSIARFVELTFITLVGVSLTLSYSKLKNREDVFSKNTLRGLTILGCAIIVTVASYFLVPNNYIIFGVLHLIGVSIIFSSFFIEFGLLNLVLGTAVIAVGFLFETIAVNTNWLIWFGIRYPGFSSIDYFPIFPWFGLILIGIYLGNKFYPFGKRKIKIKDKPNRLESVMCFLGRHSLLIYFLHIMTIISIIYLMAYIPQI